MNSQKSTTEMILKPIQNDELSQTQESTDSNVATYSSDFSTTTNATETPSEKIEKNVTSPQSKLTKSTWLWHSPAKISDEAMKEYINLLQSEKFTTVYIDITDYIDVYEGVDQNQKIVFTERLTKFVDLASESNIKVEALVGGTIWFQPKYDYVPNIILNYVIEFNKQSGNHAKIAGIQYDVESYNLPEFSNLNEQSIILSDYLNMVKTLTTKVLLESPSLKLGFAVPFWFDNVTRELPLITFNNEIKPVGFHVLDILQTIENGYIVIMDYRNKTEGPNGSIKLAEPQMNYASKNTPRVDVIIAQETTNVEPLSITFYNQPKINLDDALDNITKAFSNTKSFKGFAIHDIDGYKILIKN